jgi:type II secretory pathway component PulF
MALDLDPVVAVAKARAGGMDFNALWLRMSSQSLGSADRILLTERLTLLLETGVPLHGALRSLHEQTVNPVLKTAIGTLCDDIVSGRRFSEALARHPDLFPPTYVNLISASEEGGFLPQVLAQLVEMDEKQEKLRSTISSAMTYPGILAVFSVLVVVFILMVVFPKFSVMFTNIYKELPITTRVLITVSNVLIEHTALVFGAVAGLMAAAYVALKRPASQMALDRLKLRVPLLRTIFVKIYLTRLMRVMGISLERGVTVLATLAACRDVIANAEFQRFIGQLEIDVTEGRGIAAGFLNSDFIPVSVQQMIATGEQTGTLGKVMGRIADFYDRELTRQLTQMSKLAEPIMLLIMGVLVGTIVSSLILPIFKLSRSVH